VIDRHGHVRARTVLGRQQILSATVERHAGKTVFVRIGELPLVAIAAAGLLVALLARFRPLRFGR
jgi:apolipoprotein N-acyltransferase